MLVNQTHLPKQKKMDLWENYLKNKLGNAGVTKWINRGCTGKMPVLSKGQYLISLIWSWGKEFGV